MTAVALLSPGDGGALRPGGGFRGGEYVHPAAVDVEHRAVHVIGAAAGVPDARDHLLVARDLEPMRDAAGLSLGARALPAALADLGTGIAEARTAAEAEVKGKVKAEVIAGNLKDFLVLRGDKPTKHAFKTINASRDADELDAWLKRALQGETSAQLFPEPEIPQSPRA